MILFKMLIVLALMVFLLKKKIPFGNAMLAASILLFIVTNPSLDILFTSILKTVSNPGTWSMLLTLYLVMCLEYMLRTSGLLKDLTASARKLFRSDRALLGFMPAFLGFLPSLGGAIFSAPLVKEASKCYNLTPERLTAINYWFRHVWEYCNPILPALLLASQLTRIPMGTLISHQFILSVAAILIGIPFLLTGKSYRQTSNTETQKPLESGEALPEINQADFLDMKTSIRSILLGAGPIILNLFLVAVFNMNPALSLGLVLLGMALILKLNRVKIQHLLLSSFDKPMLWGVLNILLFQQMLETTGTIDQIVAVFEGSGIPAMAIISITAFILGLLTGNTQGFIAVAFPLVIPLAPGNLDVIALGYIAGMFGTMTSPAHLCQIVTLEYFKADYFKSLLPIIYMEILLLIFTLCYIYFF